MKPVESWKLIPYMCVDGKVRAQWRREVVEPRQGRHIVIWGPVVPV